MLSLEKLNWNLSPEGRARIIAMDQAFRGWVEEYFDHMPPGRAQTDQEVLQEIFGYILPRHVRLAALEKMFESLGIPTAKIIDFLRLAYLETIDKIEATQWKLIDDDWKRVKAQARDMGDPWTTPLY